ncbi:MAG: hypothetical protein Ct9H300mP11_22550 [Chloroflexota bacterium]|nr:MAG: hypothetical protein Ct9H300mP11_22550 [Chloroflexota bacterium]
MVTGVIGVTLWTDDPERMFDFYHNVLRLPLHSRHDDFIAFELGEVRFNIGRHSEISGGSKDPFRFMPHLGVEDIHAETKPPLWLRGRVHSPTGSRGLGWLGSYI